MGNMFETLECINRRPKPFEHYTARELWTDEHTSQRMLAYHLNGDIDVASRTFAFIERSAQWMASHFNVGPQTKIADFGCGPGLYATRLARTGAAVTGIDFSERSIDYARDIAAKESLDINYVTQSYLEFDTADRFDLILMIMCDYCALSPTQRGDLLQRFFTLLKPGGAALLDAYSLDAFEARQEKTVYERNLLDGFWSPNAYYGFLNTLKYEAEKVVLDKYTIVEAERTRTVYNWLQYFSVDALEREVRESGLEVEDVFADVAGATFNPERSEFAAVARKPQ